MLPLLIAANIVAGTFCMVSFISLIDRNSAQYNCKLFIFCALSIWLLGLPLLFIATVIMFISRYTMFPKRGWVPVDA